MSANLDVQNRNSVELMGKDASICPQPEDNKLKTVNDMETTEQHHQLNEHIDQSQDHRPQNQTDSPTAEIISNDGFENSVDNNSNDSMPFVELDNITTQVVSNDNDPGIIDEHGKVTVEQIESNKIGSQDTTMVSPSDSGKAFVKKYSVYLHLERVIHRCFYPYSQLQSMY